ncbi:hypothetical protein CV093_10245 [Oceanobacillus sp. 143]|nr:hypothetical protein CV093_10245 [Oceanobacillus sp. 143]
MLLSLSKTGCHGARYIYRTIYDDQRFDHSSQLISRVNYYLSHKLNGEFEEVREEVEKFQVNTLSIEYRMAKHILLDEIEEAVDSLISYSNTISDNEFLHVIDWPLIKVIKDNEKVKSFIKVN